MTTTTLCNDSAVCLIEIAWDNGFTGVLGPRPQNYTLTVTNDTIFFCDLADGPDNEEYRTLCWNCLILDNDFVTAIVPGDPKDVLRELVCLPKGKRIEYLSTKAKAALREVCNDPLTEITIKEKVSSFK